MISSFYSPSLHQKLPRATYAFGNSSPQTSNVAQWKSSTVKERVVNIWWRGRPEDVVNDVLEVYPDAYFTGIITAEGMLVIDQADHIKCVALPPRRLGLPPFECNGPIRPPLETSALVAAFSNVRYFVAPQAAASNDAHNSVDHVTKSDEETITSKVIPIFSRQHRP